MAPPVSRCGPCPATAFPAAAWAPASTRSEGFEADRAMPPAAREAPAVDEVVVAASAPVASSSPAASTPPFRRGPPPALSQMLLATAARPSPVTHHRPAPATGMCKVGMVRRAGRMMRHGGTNERPAPTKRPPPASDATFRPGVRPIRMRQPHPWRFPPSIGLHRPCRLVYHCALALSCHECQDRQKNFAFGSCLLAGRPQLR